MRSLSNMIKAYAVRYEEMKITIDTHLRIDQDLAFKKIPRKIITDINEANQKLQEHKDEGFVEGINAAVIEEIPTEDELSKASRILEEAKAEAENILAEAKKEAEQIKNDTYLASQKKGFEDGFQQGNLKTQKLMQELEEKERQLQAEYDRQIEEIEPKMAQIMCSLMEKITGIMVNDNQDVILHLVNNALKNIEKSNEYTLRVARDDYELVTSRKDELNIYIGEALLNINEDSSLKKNQCFIESGQYVIDCSLDVQLNNLFTDLKLLGGV